jgi:hypothetical protein
VLEDVGGGDELDPPEQDPNVLWHPVPQYASEEPQKPLERV